MYTYDAHLKRVVDADTLDVIIDLGSGCFKQERIRLAVVDAPERFTEEGKAATRYIKQLFNTHGKHCKLESVKVARKSRDRYGRYVCFLRIKSLLVNDDMIKSGHAKKWLKPV